MRKNFTKNNLLTLSKSTKLKKFVASRILSQIHKEDFKKNLINDNNEDTIELINDKTFNELIKLSISFENFKRKSFINEEISVET